MYGFQRGANQTDRNNIRRLSDEGVSIDRISQMLMIDPNCVKSFVDHFANKGVKVSLNKTGAKRGRKPKAAGAPPSPPVIED